MNSRLTSFLGISLILTPASYAKAAPGSIHFTRDVVPVLTKLGCNSGACHGSLQGRGGFRLSLLGFDPQMDYDALVREARGRRIFPAAPEQSLFLLKPTMAVPHGGKKRLTKDSDRYKLLRDWIVQGLKGPSGQDPQVIRLQVAPNDVVLQPGQEANLQVNAVWSDGVSQDVSSLALFETTKDTVAEVDTAGKTKAMKPGRAAVTIRYMGQVAAVPVTVPYGSEGAEASLPRHNYIDDFILAEWKKLGVKPAPLAGDHEFIRRIYLDLIGAVPTPEEIKRFVFSTDPAKRNKLIDELLDRPEYVDYWTLKWSDLLRAHKKTLGEKGLGSFNTWLRQSLRENRPATRLVKELLTSQGNLYATGAAAFFYVDKTPEDLAETTAQVFLGIRLQCAKCHHHPFEVWSQDDYYGLAAFFARVQRKDTGDDGNFGGAQSVRLGPLANVVHPNTGKVIPPKVPSTQQPALSTQPADVRVVLAGWITAKDNPFFARNIVNRYWGYMFGRGLVEPIDDLRATNPASHPALLSALEKDFVEHNYDVKHLLRTLCQARAYQLAAELAPERDQEGTFFTHRRPRRIPAEVLLDAVNHACGTEEKFDSLPPGTRAIALPDPSVASYFLDTFGRPKRTSTCECERGTRPDLSQVLHLANSDVLHQKLTAPEGRIAKLLKAGKSDADMAEELFLVTLCRPPTDAERAKVLKLVTSSPSRKEGLEDVLWALVNCAEFMFNH